MKLSMAMGSHLPVLLKVLSMTEGPVLELGSGLCSTPFLHWTCFDTHRPLVTYEDSDYYYNLIAKRYANLMFHEVNFVSDWSGIPIEIPWSVVLIDHASDRRAIDAVRVAQWAQYVVVHDTCSKYDTLYKYQDVYPAYQYRRDYLSAKPHTTLLSNYHDLEEVDLNW